MKPAALKPQRLDVPKFARAGARLEGQAPLARMLRLSDGTCPPDHAAEALVRWSAEGSQREVLGGVPEWRLRLRAQATVWLNCQRCLQPMAVELAVDRVFRFARTDEEAAELDEVSEDEDVLSLGRPLDLLGLVEDELIMALPIVPRHEACPQPLQAPEPSAVAPAARKADPVQAGMDEEDATARPNPFAVLGALKRQQSS
jgi:uncharacterized protein